MSDTPITLDDTSTSDNKKHVLEIPVLPLDMLQEIATSLDVRLFLTMMKCNGPLRRRLRHPYVQREALGNLLIQKNDREWTWYEDSSGIKFGPQKSCNDQDGCIRLLHWKEGKRHGAYEMWNDQGVRIQLSHWQESKRHGTWEVWNDQGVRTYLSHWQEGELLHGTCEEWNYQ